MTKEELRSHFNRVYQKLICKYVRRHEREYKDQPIDVCVSKIKDSTRDWQDKCFDQFYLMFTTLSSYKGLENLLKKFTNKNITSNIDCFIAELVIAFDIVQKNPHIEIEYEPKHLSINNESQPDLKIQFNGRKYYVQTKRLYKSISYLEVSKKLEHTELMIPYDNIPQSVGSLKSATNFTPKDENCVFIIVQVVTDDAMQENDQIADVLYGVELYRVNCETQKDFLVRHKFDNDTLIQNGGFFYSENGKRVDAYIKATEPNGLFFPYDYEMFINHTKASDKKLIYNILDICAEYNATTYFD